MKTQSYSEQFVPIGHCSSDLIPDVLKLFTGMGFVVSKGSKLARVNSDGSALVKEDRYFLRWHHGMCSGCEDVPVQRERLAGALSILELLHEQKRLLPESTVR